ncbi:hypothetical protein ACFQL1_08160 [Halomicroarcula sp. GCM10025709]|uniref:hypothetical protein n=1 Tax=Haloarcula TaxID=2237 RepID=UPI0024C27370|nr:hypothetical protein [Halomicroarcula sp. YJ-61-S]
MRWRPVALGTVGLLATALATAIVFAPGALGIDGLLGTLDAVPPAALLSLLGVAVLLVGAVAAWPTAGSAEQGTTGYATAIESPPEAATVSPDSLVGAGSTRPSATRSRVTTRRCGLSSSGSAR